MKTFWLCDLIGVAGAALFLVGVYLAFNLWVLLMVSGLMLISYATRLSYLNKRHDS